MGYDGSTPITEVFLSVREGVELGREEDLRTLLEACVAGSQKFRALAGHEPQGSALNAVLSKTAGIDPEMQAYFIQGKVVIFLSRKNSATRMVFTGDSSIGELSFWSIRGKTIARIDITTGEVEVSSEKGHVKIEVNGRTFPNLTGLLDTYDCGLHKMLLLLMDADTILTRKVDDTVISSFVFLEDREKYLDIAKDTPVQVFSEMLSYNPDVLAPVSEHTLEGFGPDETPLTAPDIVAQLFRNHYLG